MQLIDFDHFMDVVLIILRLGLIIITQIFLHFQSIQGRPLLLYHGHELVLYHVSYVQHIEVVLL